MKRNILTRTNLLVSLVIAVGFILTALLSYRANYTASIQNIQQVSELTSEGIYRQLTITMAKPVNISLTMANDSLLKALLSQEKERQDDGEYLNSIREYLSAYREKYGYDSVFLVSEASRRYYNFDGLDRTLSPEDPSNSWYFEALSSSEDHRIDMGRDNVSTANDSVTVFVDCTLRDASGQPLGIVGVGLRIDSLQAMLRGYREQFGVDAYLVDSQGNIQLSPDSSGAQAVKLTDLSPYGEEIVSRLGGWQEADAAESFWADDQHDYVVIRYLPELDWHLVVERDTGDLLHQLGCQLAVTLLIIAAILVIILLVITRVIRSFNRQIVALTQSNEQKRQSIFQQATEQLYEHIYELDITHDRPANQATEDYFESLGAPPGTPYGQSLHIVAQKQIKLEFRQGYIDTFSPENVLKAFHSGVDSLRYEFMISTDGEDYYWMRVTAQLVLWEGDQTLHLLAYRQNIDAEKRQEERMRSLAQTDEMTGFLNKSAAQRAADQLLAAAEGQSCALFLFDIDDFKQANDLHGHAFGDTVIVAFTAAIRSHFSPDAILGRIGGDEFIALVRVQGGEAWVFQKAAEVVQALDREHTSGGSSWHITASIGVALYPQDGADREALYDRADAALYEAKGRGKNSFALYHQ